MTAPPPSDQSPAQPGYTPLPQETARDRDSIASDDSDLDPRRYRLSTLQSQGFDEQPSFLPEVHDHVRPPSYFNNMRPSHESLTQPRQSTTNNPPDEFANQAQGSYFAAMSPPGPQPAHLPTDSRSPDSVELRELDRVAPPPTYPPVAGYPDHIAAAATAGPSSHLVPGDNASEHARAKKSTDSIGSRLVRKFSSRSRASSRVQEEGGMSSRSLRRQRSLVRPERARRPKVGDPNYHSSLRGNVNTPAGPQSEVRNRRTVLTRENTLSRGRALGRKSTTKSMGGAEPAKKRSCPRPWIIWCYIATFYAPGSLLRCCGMPNPAVQLAWREKMGLVTIIMFIMACVGFLTFGFQQVVCGLSTSKQHYIKYNEISSKDVIINGRLYDVSEYAHPASSQTGDNVTPGNLRMEPVFAGAMDLSFLFQYPNGNCKGLFNIPEPDDANGNVVNFFPCVINNGTLSPDPNLNPDRSACHTTSSSRKVLSKLPYSGDQYYDWETIKGVMRKRKFVIYNGSVMDMGRLDWLVKGITPIGIFNELAQPKFQGRDVTWYIGNNRPEVGKCLEEMFRVGALDTNTIGCMASQIVLYVSLIVILGVVFIKFGLAVIFGWVMGPRLGLLKDETPEERRRRIQAIELWSDVNNHYGQPMTIRPQYSVATNNKRSRFFPRTSRFSTYMPGEEPGRAPRATNYSSVYGGIPARSQRASNFANLTANSSSHSLVFPPMPGAGIETSSPAVGASDTRAVSSTTAPDFSPGAVNHPAFSSSGDQSQHSGDDLNGRTTSNHGDANSKQSLQPGMMMEKPTGEDLAYTILLVTCYSEGAHGIRTTLDSLAGTDFPTSHKCLFIICDGIITGAGESVSTPDVCLAMMKDFVITPDNVQPYSYVAIADGSKRHNMAKIYAGYYAPDESSPPEAKRARVPMILIVKCGTPAEVKEAKPGNRGKRDSQIILMSFLQHVMFDERMTELEYELFNAMWNVMGVTPDNFEIVLMVDADTKVYPDSVSRMVACMVRDPQIMGLCGETKIANKKDSWVSMIQVFEYYISHHQSKAFESVFGGVTCLPGCFCMYRIKAPKGPNGYWVPILANPDIVEYYSENVVETLHDKNLLLLGEDRFLSTLMLKTFPKRKMMFVPSAVCKTIVPDEFKVLLSQRRRWINSTVHNLLELVLVRDLCGTFFFSMQFVIFMELVGTVVLPAAISFTLYLIIVSTFTRPVPWLPLFLLAAILGLPAVLIGLTTRKMVYVGWMLIYLAALPVWNFVLPAYAFWHFDDFSWGQTRMVEGEGKGGDHGDKEGEFDSSKIVMKRWCEFEAEKRRKTTLMLNEHSASASNLPEMPMLPTSNPVPQPSNASLSTSFAAPGAVALTGGGDPTAGSSASFDKLGYMTPQMKNRISYAPSTQASSVNLALGGSSALGPMPTAPTINYEGSSSNSGSGIISDGSMEKPAGSAPSYDYPPQHSEK